MRYRVTVERNTLRFAAAHFTTFGDQCEPLHGHNYDVFVELEGELTEDAWVIDFTELKALVAALCRELDHRFLLPLESRSLLIREDEEGYEVSFQGRRYLVPREDVAPLPIDNTTAERLAEWLAGRILEGLRQRGARNLHLLTVGVEEAPGQTGWCIIPLTELASP